MAMKTESRSAVLAISCIALISSIAHLAFYCTIDVREALVGDAHYYLGIAGEIAKRDRYVDPGTYWGEIPTFGRAPGWPFMISLGLRAFPSADPDLVARILGAASNVFAAVAVYFIGRAAFRSGPVGLLAGLGYGIHPYAIYLASTGHSEPAFIFLIAVGTALAMRPGIIPRLLGAAFFGMGALTRVNFVLFAPAILGLMACRYIFAHARPDARQVATALLLLACFLAFPLGWAYRNYQVCGHFPVLSSIGGETIYGGNNDVVAFRLDNWGYWVFPDGIPEERSKRELAGEFSEYELDRYYYKQAKDWIGSHLDALPRLTLGKLVRAYVPVPWNPTPDALIASSYRAAFYLLFIVAFYLRMRPQSRPFELIFWSMALVNLATVVMFYGSARFTITIEPFMLPYAAAVILRPEIRDWWSGH